MCRLVAYVTRQPASLAAALSTQLPHFVSLSEHHRDGWGIAWYDEHHELRLKKAPEKAQASATFAELAQDIQTTALIGHLRWATPGMPLCEENTHPFGHGDLGFAHNGALSPLEAVDALIAPELLHSLTGTTDSERYFFALVTALQSPQGRLDPIAAIRSTLAKIHQVAHTSSLNCLLLTPTSLFAICDYDELAPMAQEQPEYYTLSYHSTPDAVILGSSGWQHGDGWSILGNGNALEINLETLHCTVSAVIDQTSQSEKDRQAPWQASLQR